MSKMYEFINSEDCWNELVERFGIVAVVNMCGLISFSYATCDGDNEEDTEMAQKYLQKVIKVHKNNGIVRGEYDSELNEACLNILDKFDDTILGYDAWIAMGCYENE